jgi:hypothetical protein
MKKRRSLTEGIKPNRDKEHEFVFRKKLKPAKDQPASTPASRQKKQAEPPEKQPAEQAIAAPAVIQAPPAGREPSRVPFTTRIRTDLATALKEASLKRQLAHQQPYTVQEILEEALEPWLKKHGYLP